MEATEVVALPPVTPPMLATAGEMFPRRLHAEYTSAPGSSSPVTRQRLR